MKALVYGNGNYFNCKKEAVKDEITGFINSYLPGEYMGLPVYLPDQISEIQYDVIYVMAAENAFCEMVYTLLDHGVPGEKILIGQNLKPYIGGEELFIGEEKRFFIDENCKLIYKFGSMCISFSTYDEFYGIRDVFCNRDYDFSMPGSQFVVCDIGMNIGAAALYFASRDDVAKVYGYEPFEQTYKTAVYNIQKNETLRDKIETKNVGMGNCRREQQIMYNASMVCGLSTDAEISKIAKEQYKTWGLYKGETECLNTVSIIDISEELENIIWNNKEKNKLLLKIDCEGAEYEILQRLKERDLLKDVSMIMMEWHYKGESFVRDILEESGFCLFSFAKGTSMGNIYAVNYND